MSDSTLISNHPKKLWRTPKYYKRIIIVAIVVLSATIIKFCYPPWCCTTVKIGDKCFDWLDVGLYSLWLAGPPLFFLYEYVIIFGKDEQRRLDTEQREDLKYCQELASKIWKAVSILLGILLLLKYDIELP